MYPQKSNFNSFFDYLNQRTKMAWWINLLIILIGFIPSLLVISAFGILLNLVNSQDKFNILLFSSYSSTILGIISIILLLLAGFITSTIYMLPTLIIKTRWKYIVLGLNLVLSWTGIAWIGLLIFAIILNHISETKPNIY